MDGQIVAVFRLCDHLLKALYHDEDRQCQISDAEVMTTALGSAPDGSSGSAFRHPIP